MNGAALLAPPDERQRDLLAARDERQRELTRCLARHKATTLLLAANIPGPRKHRPGLARLLGAGQDALRAAIGLELVVSRRDLLGPYLIGVSAAPPVQAKGAAVGVEAGLASGRLLDLDVYAPDGTQVDRPALGLPPRPCLVCAEPARECILLGRHRPGELDDRVDALLARWRPAPGAVDPRVLAASLVLGARRELDLTPKPGLVDRRDQGSHPDLSYPAMGTSIDLLPRYYADLLDLARDGRTLAEAVRAGAAAEERMFRAIRANAHRGYIFLSGLVLMAACAQGGGATGLGSAVGDLARAFFAAHGARDSHGAGLRERLGLGGIRAEAEAGLPAVFDHGWPAYREALEAGWAPDHAAFYLMAVLMGQVEDTTAAHRCGPEGLARLRRDGERLRRLLERGKDPVPWLAARNRAYVRWRLTMGGVADCMALVFALEATSPS
ncbi:MAG: triphosphoribosyl-dephospho-CoA synthase [Holophaga sp.]